MFIRRLHHLSGIMGIEANPSPFGDAGTLPSWLVRGLDSASLTIVCYVKYRP